MLQQKAHPLNEVRFLVNVFENLIAVLARARLGGVHYSERTAAVGPDQHHGVFAGGNVAQFALYVFGGLDGLAVDFEDHVAAADAGIICRASGLYVSHHNTLHVRWELQLVTHVSIQVLQRYAPASFTVVFTGVGRGLVRLFVDAFQRYRQIEALAVAHYLQRHFVSRTLPADSGLKLSGIVHSLAVHFGDHVAHFQACFCAGRIRFNLADESSARVVQMEEARVFRSYVIDAHADSRVLNLAVFEQRVNHRPRNLCWNGKAHPGKAPGRRDQERVDADDFTMRVHQRSAGIAGINGRIGLDEFTRFARI